MLYWRNRKWDILKFRKGTLRSIRHNNKVRHVMWLRQILTRFWGWRTQPAVYGGSPREGGKGIDGVSGFTKGVACVTVLAASRAAATWRSGMWRVDTLSIKVGLIPGKIKHEPFRVKHLAGICDNILQKKYCSAKATIPHPYLLQCFIFNHWDWVTHRFDLIIISSYNIYDVHTFSGGWRWIYIRICLIKSGSQTIYHW